MSVRVPCHYCKKEFPSKNWNWYECDKCGFKICQFCRSTHKGKHGSGSKCSQCAFGFIKGPFRIK